VGEMSQVTGGHMSPDAVQETDLRTNAPKCKS